jgi:hypothetical protein
MKYEYGGVNRRRGEREGVYVEETENRCGVEVVG